MSDFTWAHVVARARKGNQEPPRRVDLSDAEWRDRLTPEEYRITRKQGTERPFSSSMCSRFEAGIYGCVCCGETLFDASEKFESGTGWPSFTRPVRDDVVAYHEDGSLGMQRIEAVCNICDAHLGHVFPDGPEPTGLRYCINAVALKKESADLAAADGEA